MLCVLFQAEDGIRDLGRSRGLGDVYKRQAQMEYDQVKPELEALEEDLKVLLIPRDPEDSKDVIFEIRSGTGGDEASIFAGDLYRMYTRYFDTHGLKYEVLDVNEGNVGGYNKIVLEAVSYTHLTLPTSDLV